jgi:hypothetical protein
MVGGALPVAQKNSSCPLPTPIALHPPLQSLRKGGGDVRSSKYRAGVREAGAGVWGGGREEGVEQFSGYMQRENGGERDNVE